MSEPHSWLPILIQSPDGGHLHGLIWWQWDRLWTDKTLPREVELIGLGAERSKCQICRQWVSFDTAGSLKRPENFTPEEARKSEEEMEKEKRPETVHKTGPDTRKDNATAKEVLETGTEAPVEARSNSFNDF